MLLHRLPSGWPHAVELLAASASTGRILHEPTRLSFQGRLVRRHDDFPSGTSSW